MSHLQQNWLGWLIFLVSIGFAGLFFTVQRRPARLRWAVGLQLFALGILLAPYLPGFDPKDSFHLGLTTTLTSAGLTGLAFLLLVLTGFWSDRLGYILGGFFCWGVGAWLGPSWTDGLNEAGRFVFSLTPMAPYWLFLLLVIPVLIWMGWTSLITLGSTRRWVVLGLRCSLITLLALALAETQAKRQERAVTVLFLWDRSLSVPTEYEGDVDQREDRLRQFINESVAKRGTGHEGDLTGLIVFGKQPRLELPPASVPKLGLKKIQSALDDSHTDIAAALKLALASFPEGTGKRIVLMSDGNENLGQAEEQARIAKQNGVQIDVVPLASARREPTEVLVERIEAPPHTEEGARIPIRVVVRSFHPHVVVGSLQLDKVTMNLVKGKAASVEQAVFDREPVANSKVELRQGLNVFFFQQAASKERDAANYEVRFIPGHVQSATTGKKLSDGLPGDRVENNRASASVMTRGKRRVLVVEPKIGDHKLLVDRLIGSKSGLKIAAVEPEPAKDAPPQIGRLPSDPDSLAFFLSQFDAVILANVPAESISEEQQKVIRGQVHDQGLGLIMIGGNQSFGAGGWQNSEIEKALPVTMELKSMKVEGKSGLVLIMHASEMSDGNAWQRKIAKLAIEKLSSHDMLGQIHYDHTGKGHNWHIPFKEVATHRADIMKLVDSMIPGDMPDVDPAFQLSLAELTNPNYQLGTKHIILISDGDHWNATPAMLAALKAARITCTTVCITTHGQNEIQKMAFVAQYLKGRSYHITNPNQLPAIYIRESRLVSQAFVHEGKFFPQLLEKRGPTEGMGKLQDLYGFVRTTKRPSPLVSTAIETPAIGGYTFPILAQWQYGLGKAVAFTSDARTIPEGQAFWDRDWANADLYTRFWEQTVEWALRPLESGKHLRLATEQRDGRVRVVLEAREQDKTPITEIEEIKAHVSSPGQKANDKTITLKFEQKSGGTFEAEFPTEDVGTYFVTIQARWKDKEGKVVNDAARAGVTIPYSPEFAEMESNPSLLEKLRDITAGNSYTEDATVLQQVARSSDIYRPVPMSQPSLQPLWPWLTLLTALCLLFDIAVRRIALEPSAVIAPVANLWRRLRKQQAEVAVPEFIARLQTRKAKSEEQLERQKAARRFEATPGTPSSSPAPTPTAATPGTPPPPKPAPKAEPKNDDPADFAARLMQAKKRAQERDKNRPKD